MHQPLPQLRHADLAVSEVVVEADVADTLVMRRVRLHNYTLPILMRFGKALRN